MGLACAPIDVTNTVTVRPRAEPSEQFGGEQLVAREFVADYVQVNARLLVEIRELQSCVTTRHVPVLRVEKVHRTNRGFVIWDFALGTFTGGFAALAFARPKLFSDRLVDGTGREAYDYTSAYVVGGVFAVISAGLLAAGIVDAHRSRDTTRYADAFEVELGPAQPCANTQPAPLAKRGVRLIIDGGAIELEAMTNATGRTRFELPAWDAPVPMGDRLPAVIEIATINGDDVEPRVLVLSLRAPFTGMTDAHSGVADTRRTPQLDQGPSIESIEPIELIEGPQPP
ncbi:hypothetical protein DB30_01109 [Enhygromyxa salina]|uniref:Uncharacterized protein n=1 Tax=Enhygromyxa salina TaxID=215803 RepID=A0A0C2CNH0_9BACT|nr:hypothetical protein DB30_01109 [Enhygromyxa salina]